MRIEGVAMVKDEGDIIESFVRHHLRLLDALWLIDNRSSDDTLQILQALRQEGVPVRVRQEGRSPHPQQKVISEVVSGWHDPIDWLFLLDADEFVDAGSRAQLEEILAPLDRDTCYLAPWSFMVPTAKDDQATRDPLRRITHRRDAPTPPYLSKVVIPAGLLGRADVRVTAGNHNLSSSVEVPHVALEGLEIAHYPIRSDGQLRRKAVLGAWTAATRVHRGPGESQHWRLMRDEVLAGRTVTGEQLQWFAANYAEPRPWTDWALIERPLRLPPSERLRYTAQERDWRDYAIAHADAHFRALDVRVLDHPALVKTARGVMAIPDGPLADVLLEHGDWAPDLLTLINALIQPGDTVMHCDAGPGYITVGISAEAQVFAQGDDAWLQSNLLLTDREDVAVHGLPASADLLIGPEPTLLAPRMLLLGESAVPPEEYLTLPLRIRQEPRRDHRSALPVRPTLPALPAILAFRPTDELCEDLAPYFDAHPPGQRWEAHRVIETLIMRQRMRRYKKQQKSRGPAASPLERRYALEEQLRVDPIVQQLVLAGEIEAMRDRIRHFEPDAPEQALCQLELQLRHEVVAEAGVLPPLGNDGSAPGPVAASSVREVLAELEREPSPFRPLAAFEPVSRRFRKTHETRRNLLDHPVGAVHVLRSLRQCGMAQWAESQLQGRVVLTFETASPDVTTAPTGVGVAIEATGGLTMLQADQRAASTSVLTLWLFPAAAPPAGQAAVLV